MNKNKKVVWLTAIGVATFCIVLYFILDYYYSQGTERPCEPGTKTIDIRDFVIQYSSYSVQLEATINEKSKLTGKVEPVQLQQLCEAMQQTIEFRKWLVASYNSCAISRAQYAAYGAQFQNLDVLARQINALAAQAETSTAGSRDTTVAEPTTLKELVGQYVKLSQQLSKE